MKLVEVVYMHGGNKAVFYFMAEGRVDFRVLVKELARELHIRVEMRQIGVRDASKMIGGIGPCGQVLCCSRYIKEFGTVSIKMAKEQDLVLNPEKVSGQCGRLMCCLAYENQVYKEKSKGLPKIGRIVMTPDGEGRVRDRDILRSFVRVQLENQHEYKTFELKDIRPVNRNGQGEQKNNDE
jgi:cell fate regulator YaaT (PSP1 superfamily)